MAYRTRRRSSYRAAPRRSTRARPSRRRTSRRKSTRASPKIVIQVIGAPGAGVPVSASQLGKKTRRVMRARY